MPDRTLVSQCAPTLAGLKTASLFCLRGPGLCGTWKVYHDPDGARRCFDRYRRCTRIYCDRLQAGFSVERLTVAS